MNWTELRPVLRTKFGRDFHFYNDQYKSGTRRIKICTPTPELVLNFIKLISPNSDVKIYKNYCPWTERVSKRVTIHYR